MNIKENQKASIPYMWQYLFGLPEREKERGLTVLSQPSHGWTGLVLVLLYQECNQI